jgi:hypothetical protein
VNLSILPRLVDLMYCYFGSETLTSDARFGGV